MYHIAIMKKSLGFLEKIELGIKTIESRWYKNKKNPFGKVKSGDILYFKNTGEKISLVSKVSEVLEIENLNENIIKSVLTKYQKKLGIDDKNKFFENVKDKKYSVLMFLEEVKKVEPFDIDKKGFGSMCSFISIDNIDKIKK